MFDPYYKWLAILPKDQPPNHYRLLGLELYERDPDVIEGSADRAMGYIRQYQSGEHAILAAKLLNEIASARICLLKAKTKAEYDAKLKMELTVRKPIQVENEDISYEIGTAHSEIELPPKRIPSQKKNGVRKKKKKAELVSRSHIAYRIGAIAIVLLVLALTNWRGTPDLKREVNDANNMNSKREVAEKTSTERMRENELVAEPIRTEAKPALVAEAANSSIPKNEPPTDFSAPLTAPDPGSTASLIDNRTQSPMIPGEAAKPNEPLAKGKWLDLLGHVRLPEHAQVGTWQRQAQSLVSDPGEDARLMVPVALRGSYELKCEFTRKSGDQNVSIVFPVGFAACAVSLSLNAGAASGFNLIDGTSPETLPADSTAVVRPGRLENGKRHLLGIDVALAGERVTLKAVLDENRLLEWRGNVSQLSTSPYLMIPCHQSVGVIASNSVTEIHKLELFLKKDCKGYSLGSDWANPLSDVAAVPPKEVASICVEWNGRKYYFTSKAMTLPLAQRLVAKLHGRLLTISSEAEKAFIMKQLRDRDCWTSAWRQQGDQEWRDERNRPMPFLGWSVSGEPNLLPRELNTMIRAKQPAELSGLCDVPPWYENYVCIEWGDEYKSDQ